MDEKTQELLKRGEELLKRGQKQLEQPLPPPPKPEKE